MPKIVVYQTASVWFVKNEYFMAKIDVCRSLLPSDRVIWWDIKMTSPVDVTSEFKCKFYKHLGSPNLATIAKFDEIVKIGGCTQLVIASRWVREPFLAVYQIMTPFAGATISWVQPLIMLILTISSNLVIIAKLGDPKCLYNLHLNSDVMSFSCLIQSCDR